MEALNMPDAFQQLAPWLVLLAPPPAVEMVDWVTTAAIGGRKVLVIEPRPEQAERLEEQLMQREIPTVKVCRELIGAENIFINWYHFNDPRRDGIMPLEVLQKERPNLRLLRQERRPQRRLEEVLDLWSTSLAEPLGEGGVLQIPPELAEATLAGCGAWLQRLEMVQVWGAAKDPVVCLAERLEPLGFRLEIEESDHQLWRVDATEQLRIARKAWAEEKQVLIEQLAELQADRNRLQDKQEQISSELDEVLSLLEGATAASP